MNAGENHFHHISPSCLLLSEVVNLALQRNGPKDASGKQRNELMRRLNSPADWANARSISPNMLCTAAGSGTPQWTVTG